MTGGKVTVTVNSRLQFEQWVPFPLGRVFLFFANPQNLPLIMPPATGTRIDHLTLVPPPKHPATNVPSMAGVGSEIVTSFRLFPFLPFRARWVALITEFEWDHHFADIQKSGPFKRFHHRHELAAETREGVAGTIVRDVIEYDVGFGPFGSVANQFFVNRQFQRTFAYRQAALVRLLD
jgi:ligand-binding SRPBCC domain-containing protein